MANPQVIDTNRGLNSAGQYKNLQSSSLDNVRGMFGYGDDGNASSGRTFLRGRGYSDEQIDKFAQGLNNRKYGRGSFVTYRHPEDTGGQNQYMFRIGSDVFSADPTGNFTAQNQGGGALTRQEMRGKRRATAADLRQDDRTLRNIARTSNTNTEALEKARQAGLAYGEIAPNYVVVPRMNQRSGAAQPASGVGAPPAPAAGAGAPPATGAQKPAAPVAPVAPAAQAAGAGAGVQVENSNKGVAGAKVGDWLVRNDGTKVQLTQKDIDWAKNKIAPPPPPVAGSEAGIAAREQQKGLNALQQQVLQQGAKPMVNEEGLQDIQENPYQQKLEQGLANMYNVGGALPPLPPKGTPPAGNPLSTLPPLPPKPKAEEAVDPKVESPKAEKPKEEAPKEEAPKEEAPKEEKPKEDAAKDEQKASELVGKPYRFGKKAAKKTVRELKKADRQREKEEKKSKKKDEKSEKKDDNYVSDETLKNIIDAVRM